MKVKVEAGPEIWVAVGVSAFEEVKELSELFEGLFFGEEDKDESAKRMVGPKEVRVIVTKSKKRMEEVVEEASARRNIRGFLPLNK